MTLPSYLLPLIKSVKVDTKVTMLAKIESYELFIKTVTQRQQPLRKTFWKQEQKARLTSTEQSLIDTLLTSQVELPSSLTYGKEVSENLAELYFQTVLKLWSGVKPNSITSEGVELLKNVPAVNFAPPNVGVDLKPGTGMVLKHFEKARFVPWGKKRFLNDCSNTISLQYNVDVNVGEVLNKLNHEEYAKYIDIYDVFSVEFLFKKIPKFTYTVLSVLLVVVLTGLVTSIITFGFYTLLFVFMGFGVALALFAAFMMVFEDYVYNTDLTYVKTTPLGLRLAEETLPWDRFLLSSGDKSGYLVFEK